MPEVAARIPFNPNSIIHRGIVDLAAFDAWLASSSIRVGVAEALNDQGIEADDVAYELGLKALRAELANDPGDYWDGLN